MIKNYLLISITFTFLLVGCKTQNQLAGAFRNYEETPETSPHALVRLISDGAIYMTPQSSCFAYTSPRSGLAISNNRLYIGARGFNDQKRGVVGEAPKGLATGEFRVDANKPLTLKYIVVWRSGDYDYSCGYKGSFIPEENKHYQIETQKFQRDKCGMIINEIKPSFQIIHPAEVADCD